MELLWPLQELFSRVPILHSLDCSTKEERTQGYGGERGYYLEPYHRVKGTLFGTLAANINILYCPNLSQLPQGVASYIRQLDAAPLTSNNYQPQQQPPPLTLPTTPSRATTIPADPTASSSTSYVASSSTQPIYLTSPIDDNIFYHEDSLDQLAETWLKAEEGYYTTLGRRKSHTRSFHHLSGAEAEHSTPFWMAVKELENTILHVPANQPSEFQSITKTLIKCKDTRSGLSYKESDLIKLTSHPTLSMYTSADIRREFEAAARPFWKEWAEFERILTFLPGDAICRGHAQLLLQTYRAKRQDNINKLEELFTLPSNKKIAKSLL